jgi:diacylglycerol kinase (ATP)
MAARDIEEIFLFVNPKSGGNKGQLFLQVPQPFEVAVPHGTVSLHIFSLLEGTSGDKPGFHALAKTLSAPRGPRHVKAIVGGGDGTIMWVVQEAEKHGIDVLQRLHIGIVPLGTGNDFSRAAGWGGINPPETMLDDDCKFLRDLVCSWTKGRADLHDVWHVQLAVDDEHGQLLKVGAEKQEKVMESKCIESPMLNYLSIGQDSEVGFDFEKNRGKSQLGNILQYACSGIKVSADTFSSDTIQAIVQGLYHGEDKDGAPIFCTDEDEQTERDAPRLRKDPHILLVLNIKSYAGGHAPRLWQASVMRHGVDPPMDKGLLGRASHPGDGKLDVLTLRYAARVVTGNLVGGRRVFWGAPLYFDFHEYSDADNVSFFNIDGEFYKAVNPTSMRITHGGKLQVLHSESSMAHLHKAHPKEIEEDSTTEDEGGQTESEGTMFSWLGCCATGPSFTDDSEPR